ncbi:hypothetical protein [Azospirillum endophyticum]
MLPPDCTRHVLFGDMFCSDCRTFCFLRPDLPSLPSGLEETAGRVR